jgi:hypothetical protein
MSITLELKKNFEGYNRVVLWGLRTKWHTHRFIFQAYYENLKKVGIPVVWVDDKQSSQKVVQPGDIIFTASNMYGKMVPKKNSIADYHVPVRNDVFYCLHAENDYFRDLLNKKQYIEIKYYSNEALAYEKISEAVHYDAEKQVLYQAWGTNLLPEEFRTPVFSKTKFVFWVGSIWRGQKNEGNITEIGKLANLLSKKKLFFIPTRFIPNVFNMFLIRISRLAPAIAGLTQVEKNYLPCRMFKNISYGQLGFSNIKKFDEIFLGCNVYDPDMERQLDKVLSLSKEQYLDTIKRQQEICKKFTIAHHLNNIFLKLNQVKDKS